MCEAEGIQRPGEQIGQVVSTGPRCATPKGPEPRNTGVRPEKGVRAGRSAWGGLLQRVVRIKGRGYSSSLEAALDHFSSLL